MSEITKLPDGSAFFTAVVMSREEAMALPISKRPLNYRISSKIYHAVFETVGAASLCWEPKPGNNIFDSEKASQFAVELCFKIAEEIENLQLDKVRLDWIEQNRVQLNCSQGAQGVFHYQIGSHPSEASYRQAIDERMKAKK